MDPHHDSPIPTSNAHPQSQSPLFTTLPGELRNEIFRLALQQHVDTSRLYERETYWTRPGVEGPLAIDTALLRTCKRVWGETKDMLGKELMMRFYLGMRARAPEEYIRFPPGQPGRESMHDRIHGPMLARSMPSSAWHSVTHIHIFAQMFALREGFDKLFSFVSPTAIALAPSSLTLTLRYTDWWNWERNAAIHPFESERFFDIRMVVVPSSVRQVTVELEQIESKVAQLDAVIREMFERRDWWVLSRKDGKRLSVKGRGAEEEGAVKVWRWQGPNRFLVDVWPQQDGRPSPHAQMTWHSHHGDGDSMGYVVKALVWEVDT